MAGPVWNGMVRFNVGWLEQPLNWRKPRDIFVAAHGDLFHEAVQRWMLVKVFAVMACATWHRFQVLTKRADRMAEFCTWLQTDEGRAALEAEVASLGRVPMADGKRVPITLPLPNIWLGVSVEDQQRADERIPDLLATPAAVRFLSCEPLLGPLDLSAWCWLRTMGSDGAAVRPGIDWVIAGGESGPRSRPVHPDWIRSLRDQCLAGEVPFFFKQWGEYVPCEMAKAGHDTFSVVASNGEHLTGERAVTGEPGDANAEIIARVGKKRAGALLDGREWREMPT
jgi:protein gp37